MVVAKMTQYVGLNAVWTQPIAALARCACNAQDTVWHVDEGTEWKVQSIGAPFRKIARYNDGGLPTRARFEHLRPGKL